MNREFTYDQLLSSRKLQSLVENQTTYAVNNAELHVFETHQSADRVLLTFDEPLLASMLTGKKVMHMQGASPFAFVPGESLVLPASEQMCIDFPEATADNPTKCLALILHDTMIRRVVNQMNESKPRVDGREWSFTDSNFHFTNDIAIKQIIQRMLFLFAEDHPSKDLFTDLVLQELVIRIMQAEHLQGCQPDAGKCTSDRLAAAISYIEQNLSHQIHVTDLAKSVYMSESHFHRVFRDELGISPVAFIQNARISKASELLRSRTIHMKEIYLRCGFNSLSYFSRLFKKTRGLTPMQYRKQHLHSDL